MSLSGVVIPVSLRKVRAYQHYVQGKTVEEIALLEHVPLADVLRWREGEGGESSWDQDLARQAADLKDTVDGEMASWAKLAVETVVMTSVNTLVLAARRLQRAMGEEPTVMETIEIAKASCNVIKTLREVADGGRGKDKGSQTRTKEKNLGTMRDPPSLPTVPPANGHGGSDEGQGEPGEDAGRVRPTYEVEDEGEEGEHQ